MTSLILLYPHTHAGNTLEAGNRIVVDAATADWLLSNGIARHDRQPNPVPQPEGDGTPTLIKTTQRKESRS